MRHRSMRTLYKLVVLSFSLTLINGCGNETPSQTTAVVPVITETRSQIIEPSTTPTEDIPAIEEATKTPTLSMPTSPIQLTFVSTRSGKSSIYSMDVSCWDSDVLCFGESILLQEWNKRINSIDWSPNGDQVVFESDGNLFIAEWNGSNIIKIPSDPGSECWPRWSRDGKKIAYIFGSDIEPYQIRIYEIETGQTTRVLENVFSPRRVLWLDGDQLAYIKTNPDTDANMIVVGKLDGTIIQQMPENASDYYDILGIDFSPDGRNAVFVGKIQVGEEPDIYVIIQPDGIENITNGVGYNYAPTWSPEGDWIAFESNRTSESNRNGFYKIFITKPDGTHLQQIEQPLRENTSPAWRLIN